MSPGTRKSVWGLGTLKICPGARPGGRKSLFFSTLINDLKNQHVGHPPAGNLNFL